LRLDRWQHDRPTFIRQDTAIVWWKAKEEVSFSQFRVSTACIYVGKI